MVKSNKQRVYVSAKPKLIGRSFDIVFKCQPKSVLKLVISQASRVSKAPKLRAKLPKLV